MSRAVIDGITTRYEVTGSGPPLLMFSPGGFDSSLDSWRTVGVYRRLRLVEQLSAHHTCISFDRRESGGSGGRVQRIGWPDYVAQAVGLLDHLGIDRAHLMGGCVGCSSAVATAVAQPDRVRSLVLYSPAGGAKYRLQQHERFAVHLGYVRTQGLAGVVELARTTDDGFTKDPRVGPWAHVIRGDPSFAQTYAALDAGRYVTMLLGTVRLLFDRDSVPGPEPEDMLTLDVPALVVPGEDDSHAPSAARFLHECLPMSELWDARVAEQTDETAPARVLAFLARH